jgi:hypothetical protein
VVAGSTTSTVVTSLISISGVLSIADPPVRVTSYDSEPT